MINRNQFIKGMGATLLSLPLSACGNGEEETETPTFRFGAEMAYAPYNYTLNNYGDDCVPIENVEGQYAAGYDVSIASIVAEGLGMTPLAVKISWDGLINALNSGTIDAIIAGMSETPERAQSVDFSVPYIEDTIGVMVMADSPYRDAVMLQDLAGASVMGQKSTLYEEAAAEIPGAILPPPVDTMAGVFAMLRNGSVDAVTYPMMSEQMYLDMWPGEMVPIRFAEGEGFSITNPASIAVKKGNDELLEQINGIIGGIGDAEREELWNKAVAGTPQ